MTPSIEEDNAQLRRRVTTLERAAIASRNRLADLEEKLREIDLLCGSGWLNIDQLLPEGERPEGFGHLVVSVNEVRDILRDGPSGIREVFYEGFLDQLAQRDATVAVLARLAERASTDGDDQTLRLLGQLPTRVAEQVERVSHRKLDVA